MRGSKSDCEHLVWIYTGISKITNSPGVKKSTYLRSLKCSITGVSASGKQLKVSMTTQGKGTCICYAHTVEFCPLSALVLCMCVVDRSFIL